MNMVIIMAKRKKSKESNSPGMSVELTGLILALIGVIGFGFGYIGTIIKEFAMFLLGSWWIVNYLVHSLNHFFCHLYSFSWFIHAI